MCTFETADDILTLLVHLGYLTYDFDTKTAWIPNKEVRQEFQIPPYFPDESLLRYLKEGKHRLDTLNPGRNLETDDTFRSLLKNYVYYAYNHKTYEWEQNYAAIILSWQLESEVPS